MRRPHLTPALALLAVPLLLVGYVLSAGPAVRFVALPGPRYDRWNDTVGAIYEPLNWTCARSEPVAKAVNWYVNLWMPEGVLVGFGDY